MSLIIAGREVHSPTKVLVAYAETFRKTIRRYDAPGRGPSGVLTGEEVVRTRVIASRISNAEKEWFLERAGTAPWSQVDPELRLADLDPTREPERYDGAVTLYNHFRQPKRREVATAKISRCYT